MRLVCLPAGREAVVRVVGNLRPSDKKEVTELARASGRWHPGWCPVKDTLDGYTPETWAIWLEDRPIGIGGTAPLGDYEDVRIIWFLGTRESDVYKTGMTRICRAVARMYRDAGNVLVNLAPINQPMRLKWLEKLGFDIRWDQANDPYKGFVSFEAIPHTAPRG